MSFTKTIRHALISLFVIFWLGVYHYMSLKHFYLEPWLKRPLPRVKMLFPPAGWIMFYQVDDQSAEVQVWGLQKVKLTGSGSNISLSYDAKFLIDPHDIFRTRTIFFDNIKRGLMFGAVARQKPFCDYLEKRFPEYDGYEVKYIIHPAMTEKPESKFERIAYQCLSQRYIKNEFR